MSVLATTTGTVSVAVCAAPIPVGRCAGCGSQTRATIRAPRPNTADAPRLTTVPVRMIESPTPDQTRCRARVFDRNNCMRRISLSLRVSVNQYLLYISLQELLEIQ